MSSNKPKIKKGSKAKVLVLSEENLVHAAVGLRLYNYGPLKKLMDDLCDLSESSFASLTIKMKG